MAKPHKVTDWSVAHTCLALKCTLWLAGALVMTPYQRILEATVCRSHYRQQGSNVIDVSDNVSEELCKIADVQETVAHIAGLVSALDIVPALLAALCYLAVLSKFSPRKLLLLNTCGFFLLQSYYATVLYFYNYLNVRWIYLTGFFAFVGGGFPVFNSIVPAQIADSIPQSSLSTFQLYSSAISLVVQVAGRSASLIMMKASMWLPVTLGLAVFALAIFIVLIFFKEAPQSPRTKGSGTADHEYSYRPLDQGDEGIEMEDASPEHEAKKNLSDTIRIASAPTSVASLLRQYRPVLMQSLLPILVISLRDFGIMYRFIMPYWMSRRYHWEIRQVGWVHLGETLFTALIVAVLPSFARKFLRHPTLPTQRVSVSASATASTPSPLESSNGNHRTTESGLDQATVTKRLAHHDLTLAKICVLFSAVGTFLLGFSWSRFSALISVAILAGGTGFQDAYFSFLAGKMEDNQNGDLTKLYMLMSMMALVSADLGGWAVSGIYSVALRIDADSWWTSAPVWFCTGSFIVSWIMLQRHR